MAYEVVPCLYNTEKDLQARLHGTVCRYNNEPVYVSVRSAREIHLWDPLKIPGIHQGAQEATPFKTIFPTDPLFDISSPELGYFNYDYTVEKPNQKTENTGVKVFYIQRAPNKQWKQGLEGSNISYTKIDGAPEGRNYGSATFYSRGVIDLIRGKYPALPEAVFRLSRMTDETFKQLAVSRDIAIEKTDSDIIQVFVKRNNIGFILPNERTIHLKKGPNSWVTANILKSLKTSVV